MQLVARRATTNGVGPVLKQGAMLAQNCGGDPFC